MIRRTHILGALAGAFVLVCAAGATGEERYTATAEFEPLRGGGEGRMGVEIVIRREADHAAALALKRVLADGGQAALLGAIRTRSDGVLRLGALEHPLNLIVSFATDDGRRIAIVTARRLQVEEINEGRESLDYPFGVAIFEVDDSGRGEGVLYVAAALRLDEDGRLQVDGYQSRPGELLDIRRQ
jgi:hypothetical protein